jgi:hypothetical protein
MSEIHRSFQQPNYIEKVGYEMGAILELTEKLKEPSGIIGAIVIIAVAVFFIRWVFTDKEPKS